MVKQCPCRIQSNNRVNSELLSLADLEEFTSAAPGEVVGIKVHAGDLHGKTSWNSANLREAQDLGSRASIYGDYGCLRVASSVANKSVSSLVADLLLLGIRETAEMRRPFILEVPVGDREST